MVELHAGGGVWVLLSKWQKEGVCFRVAYRLDSVFLRGYNIASWFFNFPLFFSEPSPACSANLAPQLVLGMRVTLRFVSTFVVACRHVRYPGIFLGGNGTRVRGVLIMGSKWDGNGL